jgi:hypothetical protein
LPVPVTAESANGATVPGDRAPASRRCSYVVTATWRYGAPDPFCTAPALAGSSYCATHRALCAVDPVSSEGRRLARGQAAAASVPLPEAFPPLAMPEPVPETEPEEALVHLHLPGAATEDPI